MSSQAVLDLNTVVDGQKIGRSAILLLVIAVAALASDGFDLAAMGYIAPELIKQWKIEPAGLVPAFSSGIIGLMAGNALLGLIGDKYGRKRMIIAGLCVFGIATLVTMAVRSTADLVILRFLTGIGLGGVAPNVFALVAEVTPRRIRGRLLVIVSLGVLLGISLSGIIAGALVPQYGWRAVLLVGGVLPLLIAMVSLYFLPESIKYLLVRADRDAEVRRLARRLRPDLVIGDSTRITFPAASSPAQRGSFRRLFSNDFAIVTPLLWFCQAAIQMAIYFSLTWLPTLLQSTGSSIAEAGFSASLFSTAGLVSSLVLLIIIDRLGVISLVVLFVVGTPLVAAMALTGLSPVVHALIIAGAGFCVMGVQVGLAALLGIFYPTEIRSTGNGWTQAVGRLGALAAPLAGGVLLNMHIPIQSLVLAPAGFLAVGAVTCGTLAVICVRRFGGLHPGEFSISSPSTGAGLVAAPEAAG